MTTNKHTATRKTKSGGLVEVTIERGTWDEDTYSDGWPTGTKTHLVNKKEITLFDKDGKKITSGKYVSLMSADSPQARFKNYQEMIDKGAVASVGNAYIAQDTLDLINEAIAEADANTPRTDKQAEIEDAKAAQEARAEDWRNSAEGKAAKAEWNEYESFKREMEREDSDW